MGRKVVRRTGHWPARKKMEDLDKRKVYALIQQSIQKVSNEKTQIVSFAPYYVVDGTSGVKFTAKKGDIELNFFAGFSSDKKYSEKLLIGILKSESNEKIEKLNLDKDENGNNIQEKFSIDEKFLSADEDSLIGFTTDISKAGIFYEYESALESALEEIGERFFIFSFFVKCEE